MQLISRRSWRHLTTIKLFQVSIGYIVPGGAADLDGQLQAGDEIASVNGQNVVGASHHQVVHLMSQAARLGHVTLDIRKPPGKTCASDRWQLSANGGLTVQLI